MYFVIVKGSGLPQIGFVLVFESNHKLYKVLEWCLQDDDVVMTIRQRVTVDIVRILSTIDMVTFNHT